MTAVIDSLVFFFGFPNYLEMSKQLGISDSLLIFGRIRKFQIQSDSFGYFWMLLISNINLKIGITYGGRQKKVRPHRKNRVSQKSGYNGTVHPKLDLPMSTTLHCDWYEQIRYLMLKVLHGIVEFVHKDMKIKRQSKDCLYNWLWQQTLCF